MSIKCHFCGVTCGDDRQWCDHCGSPLVIKGKETRWLAPGDTVRFTDVFERMEVSAGSGSPHERGTARVVDAAAVEDATPATPRAAAGAFEVIGPSASVGSRREDAAEPRGGRGEQGGAHAQGGAGEAARSSPLVANPFEMIGEEASEGEASRWGDADEAGEGGAAASRSAALPVSAFEMIGPGVPIPEAAPAPQGAPEGGDASAEDGDAGVDVGDVGAADDDVSAAEGDADADVDASGAAEGDADADVDASGAAEGDADADVDAPGAAEGDADADVDAPGAAEGDAGADVDAPGAAEGDADAGSGDVSAGVEEPDAGVEASSAGDGDGGVDVDEAGAGDGDAGVDGGAQADSDAQAAALAASAARAGGRRIGGEGGASRAAGEVEVRVESLHTSYSKRRLWNVVDAVTGRRYLLEERQLDAGEAGGELEPPEGLAARYLYCPIGRRVYEGRALTLREQSRGQTLQAWRREVGHEGSGPQAIFRQLIPILEAVADIHGSGCVHLHLHPGSVWITEGGVRFSEPEVFLEAPVEGKHLRARRGYSAPEAFGRGRHPIDGRADIYSLGALLYHLISGGPPPVAAETAFTPAIPARDHRPTFPVGWGEVIARAMAPAPQARYETVQALRQAVRDRLVSMLERQRYQAPVQLLGAAETHIGYAKQKRAPINQDSVFIGHQPERDRMLMMVADGVSTATYGSGDLASGFLKARAAQVWEEVRLASAAPRGDALIERIINEANQDVVDHINEHHGPLDAPPSEVMGSTVVIAYIERGEVTVGSLGDSRAYLIRDEMMECITRDHNLFTLSLIEGLGLDEVMLMPHGEALARCLGTFNVSGRGVLEALESPFDLYRFKLLPADNLLLCTDGLFDYVGETYQQSEERIGQVVRREPHPGIACLELIVLANRGGGGDNIGVALVKVYSITEHTDYL